MRKIYAVSIATTPEVKKYNPTSLLDKPKGDGSLRKFGISILFSYNGEREKNFLRNTKTIINCKYEALVV
jgi:hypothetical protein